MESLQKPAGLHLQYFAWIPYQIHLRQTVVLQLFNKERAETFNFAVPTHIKPLILRALRGYGVADRQTTIKVWVGYFQTECLQN